MKALAGQKVEEELYSSSSQRKKQSEAGAEPFLYDTHSNLQRATIPRQHHHLMREPSTPTGQNQAVWVPPKSAAVPSLSRCHVNVNPPRAKISHRLYAALFYLKRRDNS